MGSQISLNAVHSRKQKAFPVATLKELFFRRYGVEPRPCVIRPDSARGSREMEMTLGLSDFKSFLSPSYPNVKML